MPSIVGNIKVDSVGPSSTVHIGDAVCIILSSASKNYGGASSFSPGDSYGSVSNNQNNRVITNDPDVIDNSR
ncbi:MULTISPECIES: spore germination protein [Paenibacillus]|uniref:spore germination protein n=1 Tax=Paenibacillus TaxID=44249 RepID=UPI0022B8B987|nr:spore germination protein [Paenibacillus caseinilyticus]MCZ8522416.1 spore germination protein [Paenibacillus caseinilyticus]